MATGTSEVLRQQREKRSHTAPKKKPSAKSAAKPAAKKPAAVKPAAGKVSIRDAARRVLAGGESMKAADIATAILAVRGIALKGKTPKATIAAMLSVESRKPDGIVVKTGPAEYRLR